MRVRILYDFAEIVKGNRILKRIIYKRKEKKDFIVLVMPEKDRKLNECAYQYLESYCEYNSVKELFIVTNECVDLPETPSPLKSKCSIHILKLNDKQTDSVLRFCATFYAPYLCVISLDKPYGRHDANMIGYKELTLDDIICRCLYGLKYIPSRAEGVKN